MKVLIVDFLNEILEQDEGYLKDLIEQMATPGEIKSWRKRVSDLKKCIKYLKNPKP